MGALVGSEYGNQNSVASLLRGGGFCHFFLRRNDKQYVVCADRRAVLYLWAEDIPVALITRVDA
jgi:hypothetical protein